SRCTEKRTGLMRASSSYEKPAHAIADVEQRYFRRWEPAEAAAHELQALPPMQDIRPRLGQGSLGRNALPEPREQSRGLAQVLENMTAGDAIKVPCFVWIEALEVAKEHRVEILRGWGRLGFGVCHFNDLTRNLLLDRPAQRPRSTADIQRPP